MEDDTDRHRQRAEPSVSPAINERGIRELLPREISRLYESLQQKIMGELETEDIIILLILYLMYKESGDSELLLVMGGMLLL